MLFNSTAFLLFFPLVTLVYFLLPGRVRWLWLLVCSYWFYMGWNARYALLLAASTLLTYLSGLLITGAATRRFKKLWVALCLAANLGLLFYFKYFNFAMESFGSLLRFFGGSANLPTVDVLLPVGISFYIFQALSYTLDVYREELPAEKNLLRYALFVSFFPQLVAGPIERSKNLLPQMWQVHTFDPERVRDGLLLMLWGFFEKVVIADQAAIFVGAVLDNYQSSASVEIVIAIVLFAVQIYCDFGGYSHIALGAAQVLGFTLMDNFRQPYFAKSIGEFWSRWHISLSSWLQDYLFMPLSMALTRRLRKWPKALRKKLKMLPSYIGLMVTFLVSGLWHGAAMSYVIWGGLHGLYHIVGSVTRPARTALYQKLHFRTEAFSWQLGRQLFVFFIVCVGYVFFRAPGAVDALGIFGQLLSTWDPWILLDGTLYTFGLERRGFWLLMAAIALLFWVDRQHEKGVRLRQRFAQQNCLFRWGVVFAGVMSILVFGAYGPGFNQSQFIYFQF